MPAEPRAATRAAVRRAQIPLVCIGRYDEPAECSTTRVTGIWPLGPGEFAERRGPDTAHVKRTGRLRSGRAGTVEQAPDKRQRPGLPLAAHIVLSVPFAGFRFIG